MAKNANLNNAKKAKDNEFYTPYDAIEKELQHYYPEQFKDKVVYCNCDDYKSSNFVKYFKDNFNRLGLKKLISTSYKKGSTSEKYEFDGVNEIITPLIGDGSFDSDECLNILKNECDICSSNPPWSLARRYMDVLFDSKKQFIILGSNNWVTFKNVFPHIKNGDLILGYNWNKSIEFNRPDGTTKSVGSGWYTDNY